MTLLVGCISGAAFHILVQRAFQISCSCAQGHICCAFRCIRIQGLKFIYIRVAEARVVKGKVCALRPQLGR